MKIFLEIVFWCSAFAIVHSYVLYPFLLQLLALKNKKLVAEYSQSEQLPKVAVLMSLFNEEEVIDAKIESIYKTSYPLDKLQVLIGSDNSTDNTNSIVAAKQIKFPALQFVVFKQRQGKQNIINQLIERTDAAILILSDANVFFEEATIYELVKHFAAPNIGLVDSNMINRGLKKEGISYQEKAYISREVLIKNCEGQLWGTMMGPFGGCYALRRELHEKVPSTFLVDDFYINMKVFEKGKNAINNLKARVYEDVSNNLNIEFKRKIRIATGNFQNLRTFKSFLNPFGHHPANLRALFFCYFSHKVLRWWGPFFLILIFFNLLILTILGSSFYAIIFGLYFLSLIIPLVDYLLKNFNIHFSLLRFITHFYSMNLALFIGFFRALRGVKSGIWTPTKRNQA